MRQLALNVGKKIEKILQEDDLALCSGKKCPMKSKCLRYRKTPGEKGQSYFLEAPYNLEKKSCNYFIEIGPDDKVESRFFYKELKEKYL